MNKQDKEDLLKRLSEALDQVEDPDAEVEYLTIDLANYNPDNQKNERKLSYFSVELNYNPKTKEFNMNDRSEPFTCTMGDSYCSERGYCNGDC